MPSRQLSLHGEVILMQVPLQGNMSSGQTGPEEDAARLSSVAQATRIRIDKSISIIGDGFIITAHLHHLYVLFSLDSFDCMEISLSRRMSILMVVIILLTPI